MATPTYVGNAENHGTTVSSVTLTYTSTTGNLLLVGVELNDGTQSVSSVTDSAGNDTFGNPVNQWALVAANTFNGTRTEVWACRSAASITSAVVHLTGNQDVESIIAEYSGANNYGVRGFLEVNAAQNTPVNGSGQNTKALNQSTAISIEIEQVPTQNGDMIVGFFGLLVSGLSGDSQTITGATAGTMRKNVGATAPVPNLCLVDSSTTDSNGNLDIGVALSSNIMGADPNDYNYFGASSLQGVYVIISGGFTLTYQPGFADLSDSALEYSPTDQLVLGIQLDKISENAMFGMVRLEVFHGLYKNGDTVNLPTSPVDGYQYSADELLHLWVPQSTANAESGWASAEEALWYCNWQVQQWGDTNPGQVFCEEWYCWIHGAKQPVQTNDGVLSVFTVAQRQFKNLTMAQVAYYTGLPDSDFAGDAALTQQIAQAMNHDAKFSVVNTEVMYMGEFTNGQQVPQPVSPVDGFIYLYSQVSFFLAPRWTTEGGSYTQPAKNYAFLEKFLTSIDSMGNVTTTVYNWYPSAGVTDSDSAGWGRVAVFALCSRSPAGAIVVVPGQSQPWDPTLSGNSAFDFGLHNGSAPVEVPFPVNAGDKLTFKDYDGSVIHTNVNSNEGTVMNSGSYAATDGVGGYGPWSSSSSNPNNTTDMKNYPSFFTSAGNYLGAIIGAAVDASGNVIEVIHVTTYTDSYPGTSYTVPTGAVKILLGQNCTDFLSMKNTESFKIQVGKTATSFPAGTQFAEIAETSFMPGKPLPFTLMKQVNDNTREAIMVPEIFGPAQYSDGQTVTSPVSPIDGYAYAQSELFYVWYQDAMEATTSVRLIVNECFVDPSTGECHINNCELPHGGSGVNEHDGTMQVIVIGIRNGSGRVPSAPVSSGTNPPGGVIPSDPTSGSGWTVNGMDPFANIN